MENQTALRLRIHGRVQGVGYRYWFGQAAERLGVHGWVRNRSDGTVEAVVSGPSDRLTQLIERAHEGPAAARVRHIDKETETSTGHTEFICLPTL